MIKDDYILFRCSSELKQLAENNAKEKGLSLTSYMEYLIRKDRDNMIYVYSVFDEDGDEQPLINKVLENGMAVKLDDEYILAKTDKLVIDGEIMDYYVTLDQFISWQDDTESLETAEGVIIPKADCIGLLLNELNNQYKDTGETYAEKIYNSTDPYAEIGRLINEFLKISLDLKLSNIIGEIKYITKQIDEGTFEWN